MNDLELLDDGEVALHAMGGKTVTLEWPDDAVGIDLNRDEVIELRDWLTRWLDQ